MVRPPVKTASKRRHTKSRFGCFNCKARKIKCPETHPACGNCLTKRLTCIYPSEPQLLVNSRNGIDRLRQTRSASAQLIPPQPSTTSFTVQDMGFFHHYMTVAHPYLPFGSDAVWVAGIPLLAHQYEFVMHAILSLGASHLSLISPTADIDDPSTLAIAHRGHALKGLKELMGKRDLSSQELDALLATCYALALQSGYMTDGLMDFVILIRGCAHVTEKIVRKYDGESVFPLMTSIDSLSLLPPDMDAMTVNTPQVDSGIRSLQALFPILQDEAHLRFQTSMLETLYTVKHSCLKGFLQHQQTYVVWYNMEENQFQKFINPENAISSLLFAYYVAVTVLTTPMFLAIMPQRTRFPHTILNQVQWVDAIVRQLPTRLHPYLGWPLKTIYYCGNEYGVFGTGKGETLQKVILGHVQENNAKRLPLETTAQSNTSSINTSDSSGKI